MVLTSVVSWFHWYIRKAIFVQNSVENIDILEDWKRAHLVFFQFVFMY